MLRPITRFRTHHGGRRSNSGGKAKGKAFQLDRDEQRVARRVAFLRRILGVKAEAGNASPAGGQNFCASAITAAPRSPVGRVSSQFQRSVVPRMGVHFTLAIIANS